MVDLRANVRQAVRSLARSPGFSVTAALTLALGIGAITAIFSVVRSVLLEPLPYAEPARLVHIEHPVPGENPDWKWGLSEAGYFYFREHNRSFEDIAVYEVRELAVAGEDAAHFATTAVVSGNIFGALRGGTHLGRLLVPADNRAGAGPGDAPVAVVGHEFWRGRLGSDPSIVGRTIRIMGNPVQVVGVAAPGLHLPDRRVDVWLPAAIDPANRPVNWHRFQAIGRLLPDVSIASAQADLERLKEQFPAALPGAYYAGFIENTGFSVEVDPLREQVVGSTARLLWILLGAVGLVLFIACANVGNLLLVRVEGRRAEIALRRAMGASVRDLAARYLTESVVLTGAAAGGGLLLASVGLPFLLARAPADVPRLSGITIGWEGVAFAALVALAASVAFGLLALLHSRVDFGALRQGSAGLTASHGQNRLRRSLVAGQVALALVLLTSAGLLVRTSRNLWNVDAGIDPRGVLTLDVALPPTEYRDDAAVARFYRELTERVATLPGVVAAGATTSLPLRGRTGCALVFTDDATAEQRNDGCFANPVRVTPDYFGVMGIPVRGRVPSWSEMESGRGELVVSRALAEHLWPAEDPIGRGIKGNGSRPPFYTIVGVADDVRAVALDKPPVERVYFPMVALDGAALWGSPIAMTLTVKTELAEPAILTPAIRRILQELNPAVAIGNVEPMQAIIARSTARITFAMLLLAIAAFVGLVLGAIGLYGVVTYIVEQRRREIAIRMALGARTGIIVRMVVRQSLWLVAVGLAIGGAGSLLVGRALASMLYDVAPNDPLTLALVSFLLAATALAASWLPARRASGVDPMSALR